MRLLDEHPLNKAREAAGDLPGNVILLRGCGQKLDLQSYESKYNLKPFAICPTAIIRGLMSTLQIPIIDPPGATGDYHTSFSSKFEAAQKKFLDSDSEFCFLHIKAVDETGHDRDPILRCSLLSKIDEALSNFIKGMDEAEFDTVIAITGDHTTPPLIGDHTCEPVPFVVSSVKSCTGQRKFVLDDDAKAYSEIECSKGLLGRFNGSEIMPFLIRIREALI